MKINVDTNILCNLINEIKRNKLDLSNFSNSLIKKINDASDDFEGKQYDTAKNTIINTCKNVEISLEELEKAINYLEKLMEPIEAYNKCLYKE